MKVATFVLILCILAPATSGSPTLRIRKWSKFSFLFASEVKSTTVSPVTMPTTPRILQMEVTSKLANGRHPDCLMQIPDTSLFRGFMWPFYTFDSKINACTVVYGVTVRLNAPNVFNSYKSCRRKCCPYGWC